MFLFLIGVILHAVERNGEKVKKKIAKDTNIIRYKADPKKGLTEEQVEQRIKDNLVNFDTSLPSKSYKRIFFENFFTLFNLINLVLGIAVYLVGSYKNMLFLCIVILNTLISTIQEIRSKRTVDKLAILSASQIEVIRDGKKKEISINEIVLDDVICLKTGDQIVTDSIFLEGEIEVNESFITGEPDTLTKQKEDLLRSGSFVVSGNGIARVEHIGDENYTAQISSGAKYIKKVKSEIMTSLREIIRAVSIIIIPVGTFLLLQQLDIVGNTIPQAIVNTVAALIGMIPEGLVLLTSTVLAVSTIRLAKRKVLVQDLYCIEMLARVDVLCLDKTGTITEGKMEVKDVIPCKCKKEELEEILGQLGQASQDQNMTMEAIRQKYHAKEKWDMKKQFPFSSANKWSGVLFSEKGAYILGAPEILLEGSLYETNRSMIEKYAKEYRVLAIAKTEKELKKNQKPEEIELLGFVLLQDKIRKEANKTLDYFKKQGVEIKLISGDSPLTVSMIAKRAGVEHYESYIDMSKIAEEENLEKIAETYTIFGRVSPMQKKKLIQALKKNGHTVAMTGDGVNDVLALKEADCSVAMASGTDAARNVSQLVLLDSNFRSMPKVVEEGRRSINNLQRSASLFLVKTIYSTILAVLFIFINIQYPFMPIQLTLISVFAIGIPSFVLALEPNKNRIKGKFIKNVVAKSFPAAITIVLNIFMVFFAMKIFNLQEEQYSSICVCLTAITEFTLLFKICQPFNKIRGTLFITMVTGFVLLFIFMREFFYITTFDLRLTLILLGLACLSGVIFYLLYFLAEKVFKIKEE